MLTTTDIKKLLDAFTPIFATKDELRQAVEGSEKRMITRMDRVFNLVDSVLKEVKAMREEQAAHRLEHDDINQRLNKIELIPLIAHSLKK